MKTITCLAITIALVSAMDAVAENCEAVLDNTAYDCRFARDTGETFLGCVRFSAAGTIGDFDIRLHMEPASGATNLLGGCSCHATGSVQEPKFDATKTFTCIVRRPGGALAIGAEASRAEIRQGQITGEDGSSMLFSCKVPRGPSPSPSVRCPACQPAGAPCGSEEGMCCEGLTCSGVIGQPPACH